MTAKRQTPQKGIILDTLCRMGSHPTAGELYEEIHRSHPSISRSTVYRVLGQMEEDGLVMRVCLMGSDDRFDGNVRRHNHIRCRRCGAVADIPWVEVAPPCETAGYLITGYTVEYTGVCPACQAEEKQDDRHAQKAVVS